jgi:hypothetical protein
MSLLVPTLHVARRAAIRLASGYSSTRCWRRWMVHPVKVVQSELCFLPSKVNEAKRLRRREAENAKLNGLSADAMLGNARLAKARRAGRRNRATIAALCASFAATGFDALAQESPELLDRSVTSEQPVDPEGSRFTKGKGPERGNSYVARFEEDYSFLRDAALASDFLDPLK